MVKSFVQMGLDFNAEEHAEQNPDDKTEASYTQTDQSHLQKTGPEGQVLGDAI